MKKVERIYSVTGHDNQSTQWLLRDVFSVFGVLTAAGEQMARMLVRMLMVNGRECEELMADLRQVLRDACLNHVACHVGWAEIALTTAPRGETKIILRDQGDDLYRLCVDFGPKGSKYRIDKVVGVFEDLDIHCFVCCVGDGFNVHESSVRSWK